MKNTKVKIPEYTIIFGKNLNGEIRKFEIPTDAIMNVTIDGKKHTMKKLIEKVSATTAIYRVNDCLEFTIKGNPLLFSKSVNRYIQGTPIYQKHQAREAFTNRDVIAFIEKIICGSVVITVQVEQTKEADETVYIGLTGTEESDSHLFNVKEKLIPPNVSGIYIGDPCFTLRDTECDYECETCAYNFSIEGNDPYKDYASVEEIIIDLEAFTQE